MQNLTNIEKLFHRSKDRIKDLGEVFTPSSYVEDMLNLLVKDKRDLWSDEQISFFEPCSGHGNIVLAITNRNFKAESVVSRGPQKRSQRAFEWREWSFFSNLLLTKDYVSAGGRGKRLFNFPLRGPLEKGDRRFVA